VSARRAEAWRIWRCGPEGADLADANGAKRAFDAAWDAASKPWTVWKDAVPVVLFFATKEDAHKFVGVIREVRTGLVGTSIDD